MGEATALSGELLAWGDDSQLANHAAKTKKTHQIDKIAPTPLVGGSVHVGGSVEAVDGAPLKMKRHSTKHASAGDAATDMRRGLRAPRVAPPRKWPPSPQPPSPLQRPQSPYSEESLEEPEQPSPHHATSSPHHAASSPRERPEHLERLTPQQRPEHLERLTPQQPLKVVGLSTSSPPPLSTSSPPSRGIPFRESSGESSKPYYSPFIPSPRMSVEAEELCAARRGIRPFPMLSQMSTLPFLPI